MSYSSKTNGSKKRTGIVQKWKELPGKTKCDILLTGGKIALTAATLGAAGPVLFTDEFMGTTSTEDLSYEQEWALDAVTVDPIDLADNDFDSGTTTTSSKQSSRNRKGPPSNAKLGTASKKKAGVGNRYKY